MSKHTPEPWEYGECSNSEWWIAQTGNTEQLAYTVPVIRGYAAANAQRIVACVNACEGIPTARLEAGASDVLAYSMELKKQRDELLEALHAMVSSFHAVEYMEAHMQQAAKMARAAIAKVGGGAA